jgi:three-Cys-motif partner protein
VTNKQLALFNLPEINSESAFTFKQFRYPLWTKHKARLIELYLKYFVYITKHGTYIDGFAGPQEAEEPDMWAAKLVIESQPRRLRDFILCDLNASNIRRLNDMVSAQPPRAKGESKRSIIVKQGDFNALAPGLLGNSGIKSTTAAFCLLDQRTFECAWDTVRFIAGYKKTGTKIEIFYFLPIKWLKRALHTRTKSVDEVSRWWGGNGWTELKGLHSQSIANHFCERFRSELKYRRAFAWPIYESESGKGAVMYFMVHASDHDDAPHLMARAYRKALSRREPIEQMELRLDEWKRSRGGTA